MREELPKCSALATEEVFPEGSTVKWSLALSFAVSIGVV